MGNENISQQEIPINRDVFLLNLLHELCGSLEEVIGLEEAAGFLSLVGQRLGDWMNKTYKGALSNDQFTHEQISQILVDLKSRIKGDFYPLPECQGQRHKIMLGNRCCPFESRVQNCSSLCMITSNLFGTLIAEHLGYAKVCLQKTIAEGDDECRVIIYTKISPESENEEGREYYKPG